ncbi:MAG: polysaccharide deacetylase family protein [Selenomonadaceae bacterium]|nr:polysaccharide deacetylase family protein [Selenomonadaceae bacterium]
MLSFFAAMINYPSQNLVEKIFLFLDSTETLLYINTRENEKNLKVFKGVIAVKKLLIALAIIFAIVGGVIFYLFQREEGGVPILLYHQVNNIDQDSLTLTVEQFDAQIKYLVDEGYTIITPTELLDAWDGNGSLPPKPAVITFDDGHVEFYKNVFPILKKYNVKATVFVVTDFLNLYPNYLTWDQAREMQASGLVDFESHTLNNRVLTKIKSRDKLWDQIYGSKQAIEWYLKKPVQYIAYPGGQYDVDVEDLSKEVGYRAGFTLDYNLTHKLPQHYLLARIPIYGANEHTFFRFQLRLKGAPVFAPLKRYKEKLIDDGNEEIASLIWIP